jgi:26S proteasome regulatory subunit N9
MHADAIHDFLIEERDDAPEDLQPRFTEIEDQWERKLWHELTNSLVELYSLDDSAPHRIPLFNVFIKTFADKINKLQLVTLGLSAATQFKSPPLPHLPLLVAVAVY